MATEANYDDLPDDIWFEILASLAIEDILLMRRVSKRFAQLSRQQSVWIKAHRNLGWLLPGIAELPDSLTTFGESEDIEDTLIRAAKLDKKWTSPNPEHLAHRRFTIPSPSFCIRIVRSHIVFVGHGGGVCCYDMVGDNAVPLWEEKGEVVFEMHAECVKHGGETFINVVTVGRGGANVRARILEVKESGICHTQLVEKASVGFEPLVTGPACLHGDLVVLNQKWRGPVVFNIRSKVSFELSYSTDANFSDVSVLRHCFFAENGTLYVASSFPPGKTHLAMYVLPGHADPPEHDLPFKPPLAVFPCTLTTTFFPYIISAKFVGVYDAPDLSPGETVAHFMVLVLLDRKYSLPDRRDVLALMTIKRSSHGILACSFEPREELEVHHASPLVFKLGSSLRRAISSNTIVFPDRPEEEDEDFVALHHIRPEITGPGRQVATRLDLLFTADERRTIVNVDLDEYQGRVCVITSSDSWETPRHASDTLHIFDYV